MTNYGDGVSLVTFGAMPTGHLQVSKATSFVFPCETYSTDSCAGSGSPGAGVPSSQATGVRYFHKFDPASAFYFSFMTLKHEVTDAYILYDTDGGCTTVNKDLDIVAGVKKYDYDTDKDDLDDDDKSKVEFD